MENYQYLTVKEKLSCPTYLFSLLPNKNLSVGNLNKTGNPNIILIKKKRKIKENCGI